MRDFAKGFYNTEPWLSVRKAFIASRIGIDGGLCQECRRYGRVDADGMRVKATTAHHIVPLEVAPERAFDPDNGMALCAACHNKKHPEKGGRYR